jgi:hypothetical protein
VEYLKNSSVDFQCVTNFEFSKIAKSTHFDPKTAHFQEMPKWNIFFSYMLKNGRGRIPAI